MSRRLLADFLSVGTGGEAEVEIVTDTSALRLTGNETILGRGTNVLASDGGVPGKVLVMRNHSIVRSGRRLRVGSGTPLPVVAHVAAKCGLSGMEWACGIPGSVGGGVIMNAGAYGGQLGDVLVGVDVLTADNGTVRVERDELAISYRRTEGLPRGVIVGAELELKDGDEDEIRGLMAAYSAKRRKAQPSGRTFGSTFSRVGGTGAGWYIDRAGLKGIRIGGARISDVHANFIINEGGATSADVRRLIDIAKLTVYERFGVKLTEEVKYIGDF